MPFGRKSDSNRKTASSGADSEARGDAGHMGNSDDHAGTAATTSPRASVGQLEPIKAWRGVQFSATKSTVLISGGDGQMVSGEQPRAMCRNGQDHRAPDWKCSCGYYAVKKREDTVGYGMLAEVDLYGTVIEHDVGYRAEFMRVLALRFPRKHCEGGKFLCSGTPEMLAFPDPVEIQMHSAASVSYGMQTTQWSPPPTAVCTECATMFDRSASLQQVAARIGCEVRWDD
jgi:hypothetical protein